MVRSTRQGAPRATLRDFEREVFESDGFTHEVFRDKLLGPVTHIHA